MNRYVYQYRTYYYDAENVTIHLEYYAAKDEESVWRHVFEYMKLDRVNASCKTEHTRHANFSLDQIKKYLKDAGNARVYLYRDPIFLPLEADRNLNKSTISP